MRIKIILPICLSIAYLATSCNKYLDVQPDDKFLDKQVFSTGPSIKKALNGIYINLAKSSLYGQNLTATTVDVMAQYYNASSNENIFYQFSMYNYGDADVQSTFAAIWRDGYREILNINQFISGVNTSGNTLSQNEKALVLGEAYGLRAYLSFDLLRLFGPVYATDSMAVSIPYPTEPVTSVSPLLPANKVMSNILQDLQTADNLLANDPIITKGIQPLATSGDNFFNARNRRMNHFAVKAIQARVLLYRGNKVGALNAATEVISKTPDIFIWSPPDLSEAGIKNPDRIFSSELIFEVENTNRINVQTGYFAATNLLTSNLLAPLPAVLNTVYANNNNDYRKRSSWAVDRTTNNSLEVFFKYAAVDKPSYKNMQPLLRLSELYYIAAECEQNKSKAIAYLNTVRFNRGLANLSESSDVTLELKKEYQKEFWGEGQLFYYYKRLNYSSITSGGTNGALAMSAAKYVVPLPLSETEFR